MPGSAMCAPNAGEIARLTSEEFAASLVSGGEKPGPDYRWELLSLQIYGDIAQSAIRETGFFGRSYITCFHLLRRAEGWIITDKLFANITEKKGDEVNE